MDETLKIIEEILDYNKNAQRFLSVGSEVDKGKSEPKDDQRKQEPKTEESIAKKTELGRKELLKLKEKKKTYIIQHFSTTLINIKIQVICIKNYARQKVQKMRLKYI